MLETPKGIDAIATVTELRSNTAEVVETANASKEGVLVVKNNSPYAVVLGFDSYNELVNGSS